MTAAYAGQWSGGGTSGTSDRSASGTPALGELLVVFCAVSTNTNTAPTCTDDQGGTYTLVRTQTWDSSTDTISVFVRTKPVENATAHNVTVATGANDAGVVGVIRVSGMCRFGSSAILQSIGADNGAASGTPAFTFSSSCVTTNVTIVAVGSADTTTTEPASWTEQIEANQATPTTALEVATRDSGFTGTTVTWGATAATVWAAVGVELDGSAPSFAGSYPTTAAAMNTACGGGTWSAGWLMNATSGNVSPSFGSGTLTATSVTYSNAGMLSASTSIGFNATTDKLDGGDIYDVGTNDLLVVWVGKKAANDAGRLVSKYDAVGNGWVLGDNFGLTQLWCYENGGTESLKTPAVSYTWGPDEWVVIMACIDRGASKIRIAQYAPSIGFKANSYAGTSVAAESYDAGTASLILGDDASGSASAVCFTDVLYIGAGASVATDMANNLISRLHSFVTSLQSGTSGGGLMLLGVG